MNFYKVNQHTGLTVKDADKIAMGFAFVDKFFFNSFSDEFRKVKIRKGTMRTKE